MSHQPYDTRSTLRTLTGLDFGLRVRVEVRPPQRTIFSGSENLSARQLTSERDQMISGLRVDSYSLRAQLEQVTFALQTNVDSGDCKYALRAAYDLASLLIQGRKRGLIHSERAVKSANFALRIAELVTWRCGAFGRSHPDLSAADPDFVGAAAGRGCASSGLGAGFS